MQYTEKLHSFISTNGLFDFLLLPENISNSQISLNSRYDGWYSVTRGNTHLMLLYSVLFFVKKKCFLQIECNISDHKLSCLHSQSCWWCCPRTGANWRPSRTRHGLTVWRPRCPSVRHKLHRHTKSLQWLTLGGRYKITQLLARHCYCIHTQTQAHGETHWWFCQWSSQSRWTSVPCWTPGRNGSGWGCAERRDRGTSSPRCRLSACVSSGLKGRKGYKR